MDDLNGKDKRYNIKTLNRSSMVKETYIQRDLIDYVEGEVEEPEGSEYSHGRPDWIIHNLPSSASVQYWMEGGYTGRLSFVIRLDGYVWICNDHYGTCAGCDGFLADEKRYTESILRDAMCSLSERDAIEYIRSTDSYGWDKLKGIVQSMVNNEEFNLKNPKTRIQISRKERNEKYGEQMSGMEIIHQESK